MEVEGLNTTARAQLVVAAHPLPYYNDVVWTVLGDTGPVQVGGGDSAQRTKSGFFVQWVYWVYLFYQNTHPQCAHCALYEQV